MLYHGSKIASIKTLKPFPHNGVDGEPVVFATTDVRFALAMIHGTGDELAVGYFVDGETGTEEMYIDELIPGAFHLLEEPGILYTLEDSGFAPDARLSHLEVISKSEAAILSEKHYPDILEELKNHSIRFVTYKDVLEEIKKRGNDPKGIDISYKSNRFT